MRNVAALAALGMWACTSPDKLIGDSNVFAAPEDLSEIPETDTDDTDDSGDEPVVALSSSVDDILSGEVDEGTLVEITGLVAMTPSSDDGFFAGTSEGGANSGIFVQADSDNKGAFDVQMGQIVTIMGVYQELEDSSPEQSGADSSFAAIVVQTVNGVEVTDESTYSMPPATDVTMETLLDPSSAEQYEGSYIKLTAPTMTEVGEQMILNGSLPFDEAFVSFSDQYESLLNDLLESVKGIVGYKNGQYVLYPCSESDVNYASQSAETDLDGSKLYVSEVLAYNDELTVCNGFNWYLELNYTDVNTTALDIDTIYMQQVSAQGTTHHAKLSSTASLSPESIMLISDGDMDGCLAACNGGAYSVLSMGSVSGMSNGLPDIISAGDEITLFYAPTEEDYANGNHVLIDHIEIPVSALNNSIELSPDFDGIGTDGMSLTSGEWCESGNQLYLADYTPIYDGVGALVNGSPGNVDTHCTSQPDTGSSSQ